jgi:predicted nucleotidyltransferase
VIDDALRFAERLTAVATRGLGESVASVILHGSLALDDYVPGHSDIDLLVIVVRPLAPATMDELTYAVVAEQPRAPARVDLRVVTREVAATPPEPPPMELYVRLDPSAEPRSSRAIPESPTSSSSSRSAASAAERSTASRRAR